ncbi:MAG TPA: biosynthetic-type acetolactate synthase large subunit [Firmicutes bacterium]|nr:biosynthetic-type acetolactate synthase large subunit [Bacillota bacterium]
MKTTGAAALIEALLNQDVEVVFGYPGGAVLPLYDILLDSPIRHILTRHEQGAAHAADGYARATGKPGICIATSGPGATNLVTGLANAYMDSIPIIAITGQVATDMIGRDSFQEADITGITMPITKHNYLVKDAKDIPRIVKEAFHIATTGRPGPVLIDFPKDVSTAQTKPSHPEKVELPGYKPTYDGHIMQIQRVAKAIQHASRPVLYVGGGVISSGASEEILKLAEICDIPVTTTLMGLGAFPATHPLSLGMLGMHGTKPANYAVCECDLLIAVGARFDDRVTGKIDSFATKAKIVHIDIDPAEIGKNVRVDIPVVGDAKRVLGALLPLVKKKSHDEWREQVERWKAQFPIEYIKDGRLRPQMVVEAIAELTQGNAIITTEVGQNQMWAAQILKPVRPRTFISSGGLGTMGFGFPAAIGAQVGCPDMLVIDIAGDGSFQMNIQELATAVGHHLPVKVAILNNGYLGMVRQWQELFYGGRYSYTSLANANPDFVKLAEAYGAVGMRVTEPDEVKDALREAFKLDQVVVLDFRVEPEENVFPMVPPGGTLDNMLVGSQLREEGKQ